MKHTAVVLMMFGALGMANVARAQAQSAAPVQGVSAREVARYQVGFIYLTPMLSIERLGYDSNALNADGDPKGDFTARLTPQSKVWIPFGRRALLSADLGVGFVYYKDAESQRSVNPRITTVGEFYARRLTFSVEVGTAREFRQPNIEIEQRVKQSTDTLGAGVRVGIGRGLSIGASAYRRTNQFGEDAVLSGVNLGNTLNRDESGARLQIQEQITSLTTVGLLVETRNDRFERSPERDADGYRLSGTITLAPKALVSGDVEIGYRHVNPKSPLVPDFSGLVARAAVTNRVGGTWLTSFGWDRDMQYSLDVSRPYYLINGLSANVRRQVAGQFDSSLGASRQRSSYRNLINADVEPNAHEVSVSYTADVGYRMSRDSRLALGLVRTTRSSTLAETRKYSTTQIGLSLNYVF